MQEKLNKNRYYWIIFLLAWVFAGILVTWALISPSTKDAEGFLTGRFVLVVAAAITLVLSIFLLTWPVTASNRWFTLWVGLLILGQAAALQMIWAGRTLHYQHYLPIKEIYETAPLALGIFIIQFGLVFFGLVGYLPALWRILRSRLNSFQMLGIAAAIFLSSAAVSRDVPFYVQELFWATFVQVINLATLILVIITIPSDLLTWFQEKTSSWFGSDTPNQASSQPTISRFVLFCALWVVLVSSLLSIYSYQKHPHIQDEVAYLLQARFLAEGALSLPAPPVEKAFNFYLMQFAGERWYSATPFGWPTMLALGEFLEVPWLINPLLAGVNIILIYWIVRDLYSTRFASWTILLLSLSPWYIFMAMNYMTHTFSLFCVLLATWGIIQSRRTGRAWWAGMSGAALGVLSLIRPLEGIIIAVLLGLWAIGIGGKRLKIASISCLIIVTGLVASLNLVYNWALTGDPSIFPINAYTVELFGEGSNDFGFGPDHGMGWALDPNQGHSPVDGLINASLNAFMINVELSGWSTGSIWLIAVFVLIGGYKKSDILMLVVIIAIFGVMFFYYYSGGPDFGARYWYLMIVPLVVICLRGIQALGYRFQANAGGAHLLEERLFVGLLILSLAALFIYFPWRAIDKYFHYLDMRPDVSDLAEEIPFGSDLVLIRGRIRPDYASAAVYNPLDFSDPVPIYAYDFDIQTRNQILQYYSDRRVWFVDGPTLTNAGYRVIAGPYKAEDLLSGEESGP